MNAIQKCLEIFGIIRSIQSRAFTAVKNESEKPLKMTLKNDNGEQLFPFHLTENEVNLIAGLVTLHIRRLEGLMEEQPPVLPSHKKWMYDLEDKIQL